MSNYHVLNVSKKKDEAYVAFHITVPDENNAVPINLRVALKQMLDRDPERVISDVPWLQANFPTEYTAIENCEIYEHFRKIKFDPNLTVVQKRNILDQKYNGFATTIPDELRERLKFWGMNRDVP